MLNSNYSQCYTIMKNENFLMFIQIGNIISKIFFEGFKESGYQILLTRISKDKIWK